MGYNESDFNLFGSTDHNEYYSLLKSDIKFESINQLTDGDSAFMSLYVRIDVLGTAKQELRGYGRSYYDSKNGREELLEKIFKSEADGRKAILLYGDVGAGKSTALNYILSQYINMAKRLVLKINLKDCVFNSASFDNIDAVLQIFKNDIMRRWLAQRHSEIEVTKLNAILQAIRKDLSGAIVLVDGFDELAYEYREGFFAWYKKLVQFANNEITMVLTSRTYETEKIAENITEIEFVRLADFSEEQILSFLNKQFQSKYPSLRQDDIEQKSQNLFNLVQRNEKIRDLSLNPLMLLLICTAYVENGEQLVAKNKVQLYRFVIEFLINKRKTSDKIDIDNQKIVNFLEKFSFFLVQQPDPDSDFSLSQFSLSLLYEFRDYPKLWELTQFLYKSCGLIRITQEEQNHGTWKDPNLTFIHKSFREYLAACYIIKHQEEVDIMSIFNNDKHKIYVVFNFYLGLLSEGCNSDLLISGMVSVSSDESCIVLGQAIYEYSIRILSQTREVLFNRLKNIISNKGLSIDIKIEACDVCARLEMYSGLPMQSVTNYISCCGCKIPDIEWVKVPVQGGQDFYISKYPITNSQFRLFVEADGYNRSDFWSENGARQWNSGDGLNFLTDIGYTEERLELYTSWLKSRVGERKKKPFWFNIEPWGNSLHPVVGITWYEAVAFTKWMDTFSNDGYEIGLPTLNEWELAANLNGNYSNWSWIGEWQDNFCNTNESKIRKTSPVGIYCIKTALGIEDLTGNVYEWVNDGYTDAVCHDGLDKEALGLKLVKGGAWNFSKNEAENSDNNWDYPFIFDQNTGFRIVMRKKK